MTSEVSELTAADEYEAEAKAELESEAATSAMFRELEQERSVAMGNYHAVAEYIASGGSPPYTTEYVRVVLAAAKRTDEQLKALVEELKENAQLPEAEAALPALQAASRAAEAEYNAAVDRYNNFLRAWDELKAVKAEPFMQAVNNANAEFVAAMGSLNSKHDLIRQLRSQRFTTPEQDAEYYRRQTAKEPAAQIGGSPTIGAYGAVKASGV
jgi:hypothetical protein